MILNIFTSIMILSKRVKRQNLRNIQNNSRKCEIKFLIVTPCDVMVTQVTMKQVGTYK